MAAIKTPGSSLSNDQLLRKGGFYFLLRFKTISIVFNNHLRLNQKN